MLCVCVSAYSYTRVRECILIHTHIYEKNHLGVHGDVYQCVCMCVYVCVYVCVCVCVCVRACVCVR